jgi:hypothetical protein
MRNSGITSNGWDADLQVGATPSPRKPVEKQGAAGAVGAGRLNFCFARICGCRFQAQPEIPVRLTILIAIATASAVLLSGCFPGDNSVKPLAAHTKKCEQLGFTRGSPEHANCRLERAREATPRGASPAAAD